MGGTSTKLKGLVSQKKNNYELSETSCVTNFGQTAEKVDTSGIDCL